MLNNSLVKIQIKIVSNGSCQVQNFQGILNKSNNLLRISYEEEYEGEKVFVAFSLLSNNALRLVKKGAYSYTLELKEGESSEFLLNYGGFGVSYGCKCKSVKSEVLDDKISVYAHYQLISLNEKTSNKIYLTCVKE